MSQARYDVVALGNAIMDVIASVDDAFLVDLNIPKARMNLIDEARADMLYNALPEDRVETSGGSAGNSVACLMSLGGNAAFMGKVADDEIGRAYRSDMEKIGATFSGSPLIGGPSTACSMIAVTPDGERSMNTYLGASTEFLASDVDEKIIEDSSWLYLEGYLFDKPAAKAAFVHASEIAVKNGCKVAVTLSDVFCIERHRDAFRHLVRTHTDLVFANEEELLSLYETNDFDEALSQLRSETQFAAVTRSEKGAVVINGDTTLEIQTVPVDRVVDATGAGDGFAGGFLFGLARGLDLEVCTRLGHLAAREVIQHYGPRPEQSLQAMAKEAGLL